MRVRLGKQARSVSIVGVGCTPFKNFEDHPETKGMSEGDAFGYAALEAVRDAGLQPRDVQYFYHGAANPFMIGDSLTPNMQVADWFGVRGIGSVHHSEACCTGYVALQEAVQAVASGSYDVVLSGAVDLAASLPVVGAPGCYRRDFPLEEMLPSIPMVYDRAYGRPLDSAFGISFDNWINKYRWEFDLTDDQVDQALNGMSKSLRRDAVLNPLAFYTSDFDDAAEANGLEGADAFLSSMFNPKVTQYLRVVCGETIAGVNMFKDIAAGFRNMVGGRSASYEQELIQARETALAEMVQRASELGAEGVVGVDIDYETLGSDNGMLMVTASGTAVRFSPVS